MSFRLPTNPDAFVPPPSEQLTLARPWRGSFVYPQAQPSRNATLQEIFVTAAETEGDKPLETAPVSPRYEGPNVFARYNRDDAASIRFPLRVYAGPFARLQRAPGKPKALPYSIPDAFSEQSREFQGLANSGAISGNSGCSSPFPRQVAFAPFDANNRRGPGVLIFSVLTPADSLLAGAVLMTPDLLDTITSGGTPPQTGAASPYQQVTVTQHTAAYSQPYRPDGYPSANPSSSAQFSRARSERDPSYFMQYDAQYRGL